MEKNDLDKILDNHKHYINQDCEDWQSKRADLQGAFLQGVDLRRAFLQGAFLQGADLRGANNIPPLPIACPCEGEFIAWKKCRNKKIVKLKIPSDARRCSGTTRKCRCDKAEVLAIYNENMTFATERSAASRYDENFIYRVGETVNVDNYNNDRWYEYSTGIHFFVDFIDALSF